MATRNTTAFYAPTQAPLSTAKKAPDPSSDTTR